MTRSSAPLHDPPREAAARALHVRDLGRLPYRPALRLQRDLRDAVRAGAAPDTLLFVEHEPVVTLGRRGDRSGVLDPAALAALGIAVVPTERGGHVTYHGPGQIVAYPILDLRRFRTDLRWYIDRLEAVVLRVLASYGVEGRHDPLRRGVFTTDGKIASIGVHVSRWITLHGVALNVAPDMGHWALIAPCGEPDTPVTALAHHLGGAPPLADVRGRLAQAFGEELGVPLNHGSHQSR